MMNLNTLLLLNVQTLEVPLLHEDSEVTWKILYRKIKFANVYWELTCLRPSNRSSQLNLRQTLCYVLHPYFILVLYKLKLSYITYFDPKNHTICKEYQLKLNFVGQSWINIFKEHRQVVISTMHCNCDLLFLFSFSPFHSPFFFSFSFFLFFYPQSPGKGQFSDLTF